MKKVTKAVFPVAGMGTRFLPATKANPKEMLPIVDKPLIQYAVEEAIAAGITELVFITGRTKRSITDHFDKAYELETELEKNGKLERLEIVRNIIPEGVTCIYIRQAEPLGLGHAVLCAKPVVGDQPFVVILPDDLIDDGKRGVTKQLVEKYQQQRKSVIAVENVPKEDTYKYGIVETFLSDDDSLFKINSIVEKPSPEDAPSTLGVVGRYILSPNVFSCLEETTRGAGNEIQLTDAISMLLSKESVYAYEFEGTRYDCGSKVGYMQASVQYALKDAEIKEEFKSYLDSLN
ncbi:MAG: UTP--glucose-1-phosphate uridylyltransferase GalU [Proteobacteria bacterium]|nr:UTP--glucose-1-phosphate uridylyltransferase [Pseudomonadota bacterium]NOG59119.1 UTP--glucose-1-phosphate uridylyltransferase GalU [Pseudomonadota bacterium]